MDEYLTKTAEVIGGGAGAISRGSKSIADTVKEHKVLTGFVVGSLAAGALYFLHRRADRLKSRMDVIIEDYVPPEHRGTNVGERLHIPVETSSKRTYEAVKKYLDEVHKAVPYGTDGKSMLLTFIGSHAIRSDRELLYWLREDARPRPEAFSIYLAQRKNP